MKKYYVTMNDKHMSNWGLSAGKTNKLIFECDSWEQAEIVEQNAIKHGSMRYINIRSSKPYYCQLSNYIQFKTIEDCPFWYREKGLYGMSEGE